MTAMESPIPDAQALRALAEAIKLVEAGYQLTPVTITRDADGDKRAQFHRGWRHESSWSRDVQQIRAWWADYADTSFALRTGTVGGVDVVDLDVKDGKDGLAFWSQNAYPLSAMVVETPSGGLHLYVPACGLPTSASQFAPGVDTRGNGGLVFAPGAYIVGEAGHYHVQGGRVIALMDLMPLPAELTDAIKAAKKPVADHARDGRITIKDKEVAFKLAKATLDRVAAFPPGSATGEFRNAQMGAAMMLGRLAEAGECSWDWAREQVEDASLIVWPNGLSAKDDKNIASGLRDGPSTERWRWRKEGDAPFASASGNSDGEEPDADDVLASWTPIDLTPYIEGTIPRPEPSVGARRTDGVRFFYPGLEHAVIGETEGGKTWFLLAAAAEELRGGNRVVYVHFEENDPGSTVARLLHQFRVPAHRLVADFLFFGPEHPVPPNRITELCAERLPSLVVLDGQNEAMALHSQKISDTDGVSDFRRRLVKPWTRNGVAVATADHVVKDTSQNGLGYALGSVHKLNGLSGAAFLVENREAFGEGLKGNSGVYVVKDRPGQLRKVSKPTAISRKFHAAEMVIDDTCEEWRFFLHAPSQEGELDPEFERMREDRRERELDDEVFAVAADLIGKGLDVSSSLVAANVRRKRSSVFESLHRLVAAERIINVAYGQAARYDLPTPAKEREGRSHDHDS